MVQSGDYQGCSLVKERDKKGSNDPMKRHPGNGTQGSRSCWSAEGSVFDVRNKFRERMSQGHGSRSEGGRAIQSSYVRHLSYIKWYSTE